MGWRYHFLMRGRIPVSLLVPSGEQVRVGAATGDGSPTASATRPADDGARPAAVGAAEMVLLVEDNDDVAALVAQLLDELGFGRHARPTPRQHWVRWRMGAPSI
jgi:hypothetical protein